MRVRLPSAATAARDFDLTDARRDPAWGRARRRRAQEGHDATTISRTARRTRWPARLAGAQRTRDPRRRRARHPGRSGAMAGSGRRVGLPPLRERGRRSGRLGQRVERTRGAAGRPARGAAEAGWQRDFPRQPAREPDPGYGERDYRAQGRDWRENQYREGPYRGVPRRFAGIIGWANTTATAPMAIRATIRATAATPRLVAVRQRRRTRRAAQSSRAERLYAIGRADPRRCASGSRMHSTST